MIFRELLRVFVLSLLAITGILLVAGIVAEASQQGLKPLQVLTAIPLLVPGTLPYTIPATTLFATCVVYGRLAADNEVLAVRSGGISTLKVIWPGIFLGLCATAATLVLYRDMIPATHLRLRAAIYDDVEGLLYTLLAQNGQVVLSKSDYSLHVQEVQGHRLIQAIFKRKLDHKNTDTAAQAREAELHVDLPRNLILIRMHSGIIWKVDGTQARFPEQVFDVPLPEDLRATAPRHPRDMTWGELASFRSAWDQQIDRYREEIASLEPLHLPDKAQRDLRQHLGHLRNKANQLHRQIVGIDVERHMRPALAVSCLVFVLIGCPVGLRLSRSDTLSAFLVAFLPIILIYYPVLLCGTGLAKAGRTHLGLSVWAADVLVGLAGMWLLRGIERH
jgi:lipopolysaccharide export system permease protein